jgi:glycine C-acetyltransferase/8-amino-7-oxononanoate synthase
MTEAEPLQQTDRTYVRYRNRKFSYFSGCDYFRLSSHPKVIAALHEGLRKYGLNVAASRMTTGNHMLYHRLEERLRQFFQAEDALLVSSGYMTNLVVAQALARSFSHALVDERAHPSLLDAARLLDCPVVQFRHGEATGLAGALRRCGPAARPIVLTDGMFARDGSAAPLRDYLEALPRDGLLLVDDAHGGGVLGRTGKGTLEHAGVRRHRIIQTVTLSKAFGAFGGAILATPALRRRILNQSRLFIGSTPLPLPLAAAAIEGVGLLQTDGTLRKRLARNSLYVKNGLREAGLALDDTPGPIVALPPKGRAAAVKLKRELLAANIYPPFIKYPGGPAEGYFRFVISSEHSPGQLDRLLKVILRTEAPGRVGRK